MSEERVGDQSIANCVALVDVKSFIHLFASADFSQRLAIKCAARPPALVASETLDVDGLLVQILEQRKGRHELTGPTLTNLVC